MTKTKRTDAYVVRLVIQIPLNLADPSSYSDAVKAVAELSTGIPGATVETVSASLGKMTAVEPVPAPQAAANISSADLQKAATDEIPEFLQRKPPPKAA